MNSSQSDNDENLLKSLENYQSPIPDEVVKYYLRRGGFDCDDDKIARMVSLATQKLIIQIIRNAQSERELRRTQNAKDEDSTVFTLEDATRGLRGTGFSISKLNTCGLGDIKKKIINIST